MRMFGYGIIISDGYGGYQRWAHQRQSCLAHLIRRAEGLSERKDPEIARCGRWSRSELRRLCSMAKAPPDKGEWQTLYARLCRLITLYRDHDSDAGGLSSILKEKWNLCLPFSLKRVWNPPTIWLNEPFVLEFCGGRKVRVPEVIRANFVPAPYL